MMRYRKVKCPDPKPGKIFRASRTNTGEILESEDLVALLRNMAMSFDAEYPIWRVEIVRG